MEYTQAPQLEFKALTPHSLFKPFWFIKGLFYGKHWASHRSSQISWEQIHSSLLLTMLQGLWEHSFRQHIINTVLLVVNLFGNSWVLKPMNTKCWSIFSCRAVAWFIQVLANVLSSKQAPSAKTFFFSHQNVRSTGFDEFWSRQVPRYDCIRLLPSACSEVQSRAAMSNMVATSHISSN